MREGRQTVVLVYATSHALRAERVLAEAGIPCKLIPVPRQLSSDCGVCIRVHTGDRAAACRVLDEVGLDIQGIHDV